MFMTELTSQSSTDPINPMAPKKRKRGRWIIWTLPVIVLLVVLGYLAWTNPLLGKSLPEFSSDGIQTFTPLPVVSSEQAGIAISASQQTAVNETGKSQTEPMIKSSDAVCGQTKPMFILGLGIDEVEQADVIRLVRIDYIQKRALFLSIPRDFWVPIPGLADHNITQFRINAAYGYGEYFNGPGKGVVKFSETVYENYGITFDHYGAIHFNALQDVVDAVGGIDFYLDGPIGAYGSQGNHHLDGEQVLEFVRERDADLDRYRIMRQSVVIKALFKKLSDPAYISKLPSLGYHLIADKGVVTDLTMQDVYTFICFIQQVNEDSIIFKDIPVEMYTSTTTNFGRAVKVPKPEATTYIQDLVLNGHY